VKRVISEEEIALTKATLCVCDRLQISQRVLALVIGLSEPSVSRMGDGSFVLERGRGKAFELAQLLLQVYAALDLTLHGDDEAARAWLSAENTALGARPIDLIQSARGLVDVVGYLRGRSSL
jgi:Protein of unknown function (DUF2384)